MNEDLRKKKSDYLLELALEESLENNLDMLKYNDERISPHDFSKEHKKRMNKIFKIAEKEELRAVRQRKSFQAAAGIIIFLCFSTIAVTQVEAFRMPIVQLFMEVKEKYAFIGLQKDSRLNLSGKNAQYEPRYVPEGYVVVDVKEFEYGFRVKYEEAEGDSWYRFRYWDKIKGIKIDNEDGIISEEIINGQPAIVIQKDDEIRISIDIGVQKIYLDGNLPYAEAIKVMESVEF